MNDVAADHAGAEPISIETLLRWHPFAYREFRRIERGILVRYALLETAQREIRPLVGTGRDRLVRELATVDVFVEKAQDKLTDRAWRNDWAAAVTVIATLVFLVMAFYVAIATNPDLTTPKWLPHLVEHGSTTVVPSWPNQLISLLRGATLLGVVLAVVYFFASLARAFLHEATILRNRRHSVRLGRLFLHMKILSAATDADLLKIVAELKVDDIERCFGWNLETSTAFKDIRAETMSTSILGQILKTVEKGFQAFAKG